MDRSSRTLFISLRGIRGYGLILVFAVACLMLIVMVAFVQVCGFHSSTTSNIIKKRLALQSARSLATLARGNLAKNSLYGKNNEKLDWKGNYNNTGGRISFDNSDKNYSTNNIDGYSSKQGCHGRVVPPYSIHILAEGYCMDRKDVYEMLIKIGVFKYAVYASNQIDSGDTPLYIRGVKNTQEYQDGVFENKGHIHSNCSTNDAIIAAKNSYITGTASALGDIKIEDPSFVGGGIRPHSDSVEGPNIDITTFNPRGRQAVIELPPGAQGSLSPKKIHFFNGDIEIQNLQLNDVYIFATGNIKIFGTVTGSGAVMSLKDITIMQTSTIISGDNKVAIMAKGNVNIYGQGKSTYVQGIICCNGNFYGEHFTILGNLIAKSMDPTKGKATLKDMNVIYNEEFTEINFGEVWFDSNTKYIRFIVRNHEGFRSTIEQILESLGKGETSRMSEYMKKLDECSIKNDGTPGMLAWNDGASHPIATNMQGLWTKYKKNTAWYNPSNPKAGFFYKYFSEISGTPAGLDAYIINLSLNKYLTKVYPTRIIYQGELPETLLSK